MGFIKLATSVLDPKLCRIPKPPDLNERENENALLPLVDNLLPKGRGQGHVTYILIFGAEITPSGPIPQRSPGMGGGRGR